MSGPCSPVVIDGFWMQTHSRFDPAVETVTLFCLPHLRIRSYEYQEESLSWVAHHTWRLGLYL